MTTDMPSAVERSAVDVALAGYLLDERIVRALSLAVQDVVARLVAAREAQRNAHFVPQGPRQFHFGGFALDALECRLVAPGGGIIPLPGLEYRLLRAFAERPRRVLSRGALVEMTRRDGIAYPSERTIGVYIARLRRRLMTGGSASLISTVRSAGYVFDADVVRS